MTKTKASHLRSNLLASTAQHSIVTLDRSEVIQERFESFKRTDSEERLVRETDLAIVQALEERENYLRGRELCVQFSLQSG